MYTINAVDFSNNNMATWAANTYEEMWGVVSRMADVGRTTDPSMRYISVINESCGLEARSYLFSHRPQILISDLLRPEDFELYTEVQAAVEDAALLLAITPHPTLLYTVPYVAGVWQYAQALQFENWVVQDRFYVETQPQMLVIGSLFTSDGSAAYAVRHTHMRLI